VKEGQGKEALLSGAGWFGTARARRHQLRVLCYKCSTLQRVSQGCCWLATGSHWGTLQSCSTAAASSAPQTLP
jgi:hypothetical protein